MAIASASMPGAADSSCWWAPRSSSAARRGRPSARSAACWKNTPRSLVRRTWAPLRGRPPEPVSEGRAHDRGLEKEGARLLGKLAFHFLIATRRHGAKLHARGALEEHGEVGRFFHAGTDRQQAMVCEQNGFRVAERAADDPSFVVRHRYTGPFGEVRAAMEHGAIHVERPKRL